MAKLLENSQRDINIAYINEVYQICEKLKIDFNETFDAASTKWNFLKFYPGLVGGHCIGVDPYYLDYAARANSYKTKLILSGRNINNEMFIFIKKKIISKLKKIFPDRKKFKILICGATFKENVSDIRNSQSLNLYKSLKKDSHKVHLFDPLVKKEFLKTSFRKDLRKKLINNFYDYCFIAVKHDIFSQLGRTFFMKKCNKNHYIYDFKKAFKN